MPSGRTPSWPGPPPPGGRVLSVRERRSCRGGAHRVVLFGSGTVGALAGGLLADSFGLTVPFPLDGALLVVAAAGVAVVFHRTRRSPP